VAFSPDGLRLASAGGEAVSICECDPSRDTFTLTGLPGAVTDVAFSADGKRLVARTADGTVCSWDALTGQLVGRDVDPAPEGGPTALSPDGSLRATGDGDLVHVVRTADQRPPSDLVILRRLTDPAECRRWHSNELAAAVDKKDWHGAAQHLTELQRLAGAAEDAAALRVRYLRCRAFELGAASPDRTTFDAPDSPQERALADWYHALDWPPHLVPACLGPDAHAALLGGLRWVEGRYLAAP
jgi:WD40 repeat protein